MENNKYAKKHKERKVNLSRYLHPECKPLSAGNGLKMRLTGKSNSTLISKFFSNPELDRSSFEDQGAETEELGERETDDTEKN